ncbi:MAG: thioredoxin-like domain-containing protein [Terrimicrobiaceae bacterium]
MEKLVVLSGFLFLGVHFSASAQLTPEAISSDRSLWPKATTVSIPIDSVVIIGGKESGSIKLPAGKEYPVKSLTAEFVTIDVGGTTRELSYQETDVIEKATARKILLDARQAAIPAVPQATPEPVAQQALAKPSPPSEIQNKVAAGLPKLVALDGRKLGPFDAALLSSKKYIAAYYSAGWCGPCRKFTPDLVKWYKRNKSKQDLFEIVYVPSDRSADEMLGYMTDSKMPWPALEYESRGARTHFSGKGGRGIPSLVVFDAEGNIVAQSYVGDEYVGPRKVLEQLEDLLKESM